MKFNCTLDLSTEMKNEIDVTLIVTKNGLFYYFYFLNKIIE